MTHDEFLRLVAARLQQADIPYMVVGSIASSFYGEPRSTHDVDIVIDPSAERLERFVREVASFLYVDATAAREALRRRDMFNVIDTSSGNKADLILRKNRPFNVSEFARRRFADPEEFMIASPEDVILSKLEWSKLGESERQFRDASNLYSIKKEKLDEAYLDRWAEELDVTDLLRRVRESEE